MDKIKKIYAKIKEAKKRGKSLVSELKKLNPKELIAIKIEILKKQAIAFLMPFAGWAVLGLLAVGIILLVFYMLLGPLMEFLGSIVKGWNYLFHGTSGNVTSDDVKSVREQLEQAGVDFEEIGYVGEEMFNIWNVDGNPVVNCIFPNLSGAIFDPIFKNILQWGNAKSLCDKVMEYEKEVKNGDNTHLDDLNKIKDAGIVFYLKAYLATQQQTFSDRNYWTLDSDKGAIVVDADSEATTWWESVKSTISGSIKVEREGDKFIIDLKKAGKQDVTSYINDFAMPWQYPFIFHENTLSPDVGFKVAQLGAKYHKINLHVYYVPTKVVKEVTKDADGNIESTDNVDYNVADNSVTSTLVESQYQVKPTLMQTWYMTRTYSNIVNQYSQPEEIGVTVSNDDGTTIEYIVKKSSLDEPSFNESINCSGKNEMDNILMENPEYEVKTDATGKEIMEMTNKDRVKAYFTANNATGNAKDITGKSEYDGKSILAIKTNSEIILKSIKELYGESGDEIPVLVTDKSSAPSSNVKYEDSIGSDKYNEEKNDVNKPAIEIEGQKIPPEQDLTSSPKIVQELAQYFGNAGIIDIKKWKIGSITNFMFNANYILWPLKETTDQVSDLGSISADQVVTINSRENTDVLAPISGTITKIDDHTISIKRDATNAEGENIDGMTIILGNINISVSDGATVEAGDTVGKTGVVQDDGTIKSSITYQKLNVSGAPEDSRQDLMAMRTVATSEFVWPVQDVYVITSYYGPRKAPTAGASSYHRGIDIAGAPGSNLIAMISGTITTSSFSDSGGYTITISGNNGLTASYCHSHPSYMPSVGTQVTAGQAIGKIGPKMVTVNGVSRTNGATTGAHCHFAIKLNGNFVDPLDPNYLGKYHKNGTNY